MTDDVALTRAYLKYPPFTDLTSDDVQWRRPISQSASQNCTCKCYKHKQLAAQVTTMNLPELGDIARCVYRDCDCVEYRPVKAKKTQSGGNWFINR